MRRHLALAGFLLLCTLVAVAADDPKKDKDPNTAKDKTAPKEKLVHAGKLIGTLQGVTGAEPKLRIHVTSPPIQPKDITLLALDDLKVRTMILPPAYDDKGRLRRYTSKDLKELKGPEKLPGYKSDKSGLHAGQTILVYLVRKSIQGVRGKAKAPVENPYRVQVVVILAEPKP